MRIQTKTAQTNPKRAAVATVAVGPVFLISASLLWMVNASVMHVFSIILLIWGVGGIVGGLVSLIRSRAENKRGSS